MTMKSKQSDIEKYNNFNLIKEEPKKLNLNFDKKRVWERQFLNSNDVLNSQIDSKAIEI